MIRAVFLAAALPLIVLVALALLHPAIGGCDPITTVALLCRGMP